MVDETELCERIAQMINECSFPEGMVFTFEVVEDGVDFQWGFLDED